MITFAQFIDKWLGKKIDFDGYYGGQCVDLYRQYVKEVLGFPQSPGVGGAAEIWHSADPKYYDFIENTPLAVPEYGDIMIWSRKVDGDFGHVAIFIEGDIMNFTSLDQNWPRLDKVTKTKHNYLNIIGWLRPKKESDMTDLQEIYEYFGVNNSEELFNKALMHLGQDDGRSDWGSSEYDRGGFLGSERREVIKLRKQLENVVPSADPNPDPEKWELNGLQVTVLDSGSKICEYNYKKK